jgi:uncharacterized protein YlxW (UPF0749 family)
MTDKHTEQSTEKDTEKDTEQDRVSTGDESAPARTGERGTGPEAPGAVPEPREAPDAETADVETANAEAADVETAEAATAEAERTDAAQGTDAQETGAAAAAAGAAGPAAAKPAGTETGGTETLEPAPAEPGTAGGEPDAPDAPDETRDASAAPAADPELTGRERLVSALWPPRLTRAQVTVAVLLFALGLALAFQVRTTNDQSALRGARQEDLVRILDELDSRNQRLEDDKRDLENQRTELENSSNQAAEARRQTKKKTDQLAVLAGTVAAHGPGITLTISDPAGHVRADMLLDTLQELRAAGAEAIQINKVRVVADTYFSDDLKSGGVEIDGHRTSSPYRFRVIGNPQDLEPALNIPGGVVQSMEKEQATVAVVRSEKIIVNALRQAKQPDYARSAPE